MSGKIVIVLDNFNLTEKICDVHNGLFCRSIDDDPRIWKKSRWGKKFASGKKKKHMKRKPPMGTLADKMPDELKIAGENKQDKNWNEGRSFGPHLY